jgi:hypothetical protein
VSRTGNLLFPEDDDWVASIIKALPEKEPEKKPPSGASDSDVIEDPVAIEAEAAFAEVAAKTAVSEAIDAAGWSATALKAPAEATPEFGTAEEEWRAAEALDDLDAAIARAAGDPAFADVDDPVRDAANAAFAETDADTATRDAIDAAGWAAAAEPATEPVEYGFSPEALAALDSVIAREGIGEGIGESIRESVGEGADPVAIEAEAAFAETAAEVAAEDAVFAAGWSAMASKSGDIGGVEKLSAAELKALNLAMAKDDRDMVSLAEIDDSVRLAGDTRFTEVAADVATRDAIRMAAPGARDVPRDIPGDVPSDILAALDPLSISEQRALDAAIAEQTISRMDPGAHGDPVALEADSVFSDIAAELAIADALLAARRTPPSEAAVVAGAPRQAPAGPGLWGIEDLVRAEAEIAFEDAAYDLAYSTVDSLVTGEAAALAAFDQAIASGADPEEALALAIAAAEELDPRSFGMTLAAVQSVGPDDFLFQAPGPGEEGPDRTAPADEAAQPDQPEDAPEDLIVFARVGDNFETLPAEEQILGGLGGGPGADTLGGLAEGFEFFLDLEFVSGAGSHFRAVERDDELITGTVAAASKIEGTAGDDTLTGTSAADNIFGYAGDDILIGGRGADTLTGGTGADKFVFEGGSGADALSRATSLGTDRITDYSAADGDTFGLADADFGFGAAGTLTAGADYFESGSATLSGAPLDASGGAVGPAIVVLGDGSGTDGVDIYYTDDASAMTTDNSYQIADVDGINTGDIDSGDFTLRA